MSPQRRYTLPWTGAVLAALLSLAPAPARCQPLAAAESDPRTALGEEILSSREAESGRAIDPAYRKEVISKLRSQALEILQATARGDSQEALKAVAYPDGLVYTPVSPCRILDTRNNYPYNPIPIQPDESRAFKASGYLIPQGGSISCAASLPPGKALVAVINLVAVNAAGSGYLQAGPWSATPTEPNFPSSILNYSSGLALANAVPVALCNPLSETCTNDFFVRAKISATHVVGDLVGYFSPVSSLRYQTQVGIWASPASQTPVTINATCTNLLSPYLVIDTSLGQAAIHGHVRVRIDHVQGIDDEIRLCVGNDSMDCSACQDGHAAVHRIPAAWPSMSGIEVTLPLDTIYSSYGELSNIWVNGLAPSGSSSPDKAVGGSFVFHLIPR